MDLEEECQGLGEALGGVAAGAGRTAGASVGDSRGVVRGGCSEDLGPEDVSGVCRLPASLARVLGAKGATVKL